MRLVSSLRVRLSFSLGMSMVIVHVVPRVDKALIAD